MPRWRRWKRRPDAGAWQPPPRAIPHAAADPSGPLPAETGPTRAPDELTVWPVEGGRFGIDAHYHGVTGRERARDEEQRLAAAGLASTVRAHHTGGATLRLGPLAHDAVWIALEAFLGRPLRLPARRPGSDE
jgi:hypothetical protein